MDSFYTEYRTNVDTVISRYSEKSAAAYMKNDGSYVKITFSEIGDFLRSAEKTFQQMQLKQGDRAAILSEQSPWVVYMGIALMYAGITIVPVDASLPLEEIEKLLEFSDIRALFTTEKFYHALDSDIREHTLCFDLGHGLTVKEFEPGRQRPELAPTPDPEYDVAVVIYSSGTTGQMKGVKITYDSVLKAVPIEERLIGMNDKMTYLLVLPFNHVAGFTSAVTCFLEGCETGFIEDVDSSKLQQGLRKFEPHYFLMVPKVYEVMEQKIRAAIKAKGVVVYAAVNVLFKISKFFRKYLGINIGRKMFGSIRKEVFGKNIFGLGTGASPCKPETAEFFLNLGVLWANYYASTETNVPVAATGIMDRYSADTVGNVNRHPEIEVKIRNADEQGIGEIIVKSELMMKGYFRRPDLTEQAFENGFFKTGDYGFIDKKGYLHVTGRMKESIVLQNGKKVSPTDVDEYYLARIADYDIASRGIVCGKEQYDEIHLFVGGRNFTDSEKSDIKTRFQELSRNAPSMYKLSGIHFVPQIPRTSVGKVKRFCLEISDDEKSAEHNDSPAEKDNAAENDMGNTVCAFIKQLQELPESFEISGDMRLKEDIGMDSLNVFELCVKLDEKYGTSVETQLHDGITVSELTALLEGQGEAPEISEDLSAYPMEKTQRYERKFDRFTRLSRRIWRFEVNGLENIGDDENYIFCPNHESHFDGMWIIGCLDSRIRHNICSIAADYLFEKRIYRSGVEFMGGIPVHRSGNSAPAMKRAFECISQQKYNLLIHPEGTRTRNGKLGEFKLGAARLSADSGVKVIPVCIDGAREIFPPDRPIPHLFDWKHFRRYALRISFGAPIAPENKSVEKITEEIRTQIVQMKSEGRA